MKKGDKVTLKMNGYFGDTFTVYKNTGITIRAIQDSTGDMYEAVIGAWELLK